MHDHDADVRARALFDATPHRHPRGKVPDWDRQPDHLKEVFRRHVQEGLDAGTLARRHEERCAALIALSIRPRRSS